MTPHAHKNVACLDARAVAAFAESQVWERYAADAWKFGDLASDPLEHGAWSRLATEYQANADRLHKVGASLRAQWAAALHEATGVDAMDVQREGC